MTDLHPLCALGDAAPRQVAHGALALAERPDLALASLAVLRGVSTPAPFGLALPEPGGWAGAGAMAAFWMAPGQWMIAAEGRAEEDFAAALAAEAPGCAITEQTDGFVAIEIAAQGGARPIELLLERLVNLAPAARAPGHAARTGLEHMSVFVLRPAPERAMIVGMRSAAHSLWHALDTAAARLAGTAPA